MRTRIVPFERCRRNQVKRIMASIRIESESNQSNALTMHERIPPKKQTNAMNAIVSLHLYFIDTTHHSIVEQ